MAQSTGAGRRKGKALTPSHKEALAIGREEGRAVRDYLELLESPQHRPGRGRRRTAESVRRRLVAIDRAEVGASPLASLQLVQERLDLTAELRRLEEPGSTDDLEKAFVAAAAGYSARKGISYATWRAVGVSPAVLRRAGIRRARSTSA